MKGVMRNLSRILVLMNLIIGICSADVLYDEQFTFSGSGVMSDVGWSGPGSSGVYDSFAWVWHDGDNEKLIYTSEFTLDTDVYQGISFDFYLRKNNTYSATPGVSVAVKIGGSWYVSKTVFSETDSVYSLKTLSFDSSKDQWDTLDFASLARGSTASSDLSGIITLFGLYSDSQNLGGPCTAEYDNFTVSGNLAQRSPDITGDGKVTLIDLSRIAGSWQSLSGQPEFDSLCDLDISGQVELADLMLLASHWLEGTGPTELSRKNKFNSDWKFYKGNPSAVFEHVLQEEAETTQGENNWYLGVSTASTGTRTGLMTFDPSWYTWRSAWVFPGNNSGCFITDDRYIAEDRPPHQYMMRTKCDQGYIPRIEWVSSHPDNSSVQITFNVMFDQDNQQARILRNGAMVWEGSDSQAWAVQDYSMILPDIDNGDTLTFMQSAYSASCELKWNYLTITENAGNLDAPSASSYSDTSWDSVMLPYEPVGKRAYMTWPAETYRGAMWYRKHFSLDSSYLHKKLFLEFESANVTAEVWCNDTILTTHYGGFLPFMIDITDHVNYDGSENVIAVRVRSFNDPDIPSMPLFGGINGDVWLHVTDKLHVTDAVYAGIEAGGGIFVTYPSVSQSSAQVQVKTHVINENTASKDCTLQTHILDAAGEQVGSMSTLQNMAAGSDYTFTQSTTISNPNLWHPDTPYLYTVVTKVLDGTSVVDEYETRIGIRSIYFSKSEGFKINGQPYRWRGTNSNTGYPYIGCAVSNEAIFRDVKRLRDEGFDYLRPSPEARPCNPAYLDACDELGLLVLNPIHSNDWNDTTLFKNRCYQMMRDLIRRDRNHPCVIAWELSLNEKWWDAPEFSPTAMSIGHAEYPGDQCYIAAWKDAGRWDGSEPTVFDIHIATPSADARTYDGPLPMLVSEHGHWEYIGYGADYDSDCVRSDGELPMLSQALNHLESHNLNRALTNMTGDGVFCAADYLAYDSGTMDLFRVPKFSYYFWQSQRDPSLILNDADSGPMIKIASLWNSSSLNDVTVFSNCDEVKLYRNSNLISTQLPDTGAGVENIAEPPFTFTSVNFIAGELKAEGYIGGQLVATDIVKTPGTANRLDMSFSTNEIAPDGDVALIYVSVLDSSDVLVTHAANQVLLEIIDGPAVIMGPSQIDAQAGIASFLIRTTGAEGTINIQASSAGLTSDTASLMTVPFTPGTPPDLTTLD